MEYKLPIYQEVVERLKEPRNKIQVIVGPRQVGKTTMIEQVLSQYDSPYESVSTDGVVNASRDWLAEVWESQRMKMLVRKEERRLLVIDEVQKIDNWSEIVKAEWDRDTREKRNLLVVLLGSSRMLIQKGLTESLSGRFELIRMTHWTYTQMHDCFGWDINQYIYYGGYPGAAAFIINVKRWADYVKDSLIETTISKDALLNTKIIKPQLLRQLFELGSSYSGQELSLTKVVGLLQDRGNVSTLAEYLQTLHECELLCGLQKFAMDKARKYNSVPKFQVHNSALRSVYSDYTLPQALENPKEWGRFVESAIGAYLVSQAAICDFDVYYWRERNDEVDYILTRRNKIVAIEVKSGRRTMNHGLLRFKESYTPHRSIVVGPEALSVEDFLSMDLNLLFQ
ncbi:MAG: ATP-binding protein [Bacteroidales bacterium]|nr:ATP-binding protein [Bacteroidales bacterium]